MGHRHVSCTSSIACGKVSLYRSSVDLADGNLCLAQGDYGKAKVYFESGHKIAEEEGPTQILTETFLNKLAIVDIELGEHERALYVSLPSDHYPPYKVVSVSALRAVRR